MLKLSVKIVLGNDYFGISYHRRLTRETELRDMEEGHAW